MLLFSIVLFSLAFKASLTDLVDEYEKLIRDEIDRAQRYKFNVDNSAYFEHLNWSTPHNFGKYDFVVIGAGSAGSVVANRLSEVEKWNVLLLEAGGEEDNVTDIPDMMFWVTTSDRNWGYYSIPQSTCCQGMVDKKCSYPRGKVVGGTSTINGMMYVRGNKEDYNIWEQMGNSGWSYEDVLPYFKKSEDAEIGDVGYHSFGGPLHVSLPRPPQHPINKRFEDAMLSSNYSQTDDYNGKTQMGVGIVESTIRNGRRMSTGRAFIDPIRANRKNLKIVLNSLVTRVLIDPDSRTVWAVDFVKNGLMHRVKVDKEVIVSAGVINSPQILMLSGIGPKSELNKLDIPVIQDLPVGKHLQDHPMFPVFTVRTTLVEEQRNLRSLIIDYLNGGGTLTTAAKNTEAAFVNVNSPEHPNRPDTEFLVLLPQDTNDVSFISPAIFNFGPELINLLRQRNPFTDFSIFISLLHPRSLGEVTLKSNSPIDYPNIDLRALSDESNYDIETMYKAFQFLRDLIATPAFTQINAELMIPRNASFCRDYEPDSKQYWFCFFRYTASTTFHAVGTVRMGLNETDSVVDNKLRVHGIKNLRVADASIMPEIPSGNTNAPTIMIGERAADFIKQTFGVSN